MEMNRKGFTLVELLSVIVILSVVILIATNAVIPMTDKAKKQVLATEANKFIAAAKTLYVNEKSSGTKCFSYDEVINTGSFLIEENNGKYSYKIWLSNGTNLIDGKAPDITGDDVIVSSNEASTVCGATE